MRHVVPLRVDNPLIPQRRGFRLTKRSSSQQPNLAIGPIESVTDPRVSGNKSP
jgi:hypothetical protein